MLGWALLINNLGRRRYPLHWWAPGPTFVRNPVEDHDESLRQVEEGEIQREETEEGDLAVESDDTDSRIEEPMSGLAENTTASENEPHSDQQV